MRGAGRFGAAPLLGADGASVLVDIAGYSPDEVEELRCQGACAFQETSK